MVIAPDAKLACDLADEGRLLVHLLAPEAEAGAGGRLYVSREDGSLVCLAGDR